MLKKSYLFALLLLCFAFAGFFACKKKTIFTGDDTKNFFPLRLGKYVTYNVDSIVYIDTTCTKIETRTQLKYVITDTVRDSKNRPSYMMDVFSRSHEGDLWNHVRVIIVTPDTILPLTTTPPPNTPVHSLLYSQDGLQMMKLVFPVVEGITWDGNKYINTNDKDYAYLKDWHYTYQYKNKSYNNGYINFENTLTVLAHDESVNYPYLDSAVNAYRIYAKEVYGYNIGMIYKEWTHWNYVPSSDTTKSTNGCVKGYTVVMRAIDYN
ncbi:MAG: hypothetical protein EBX41_08695 [Chitinophagia bacterium]|nr:hypothetical protein [Chitinophagia bacterium]